jgi:hypothetical protein
MEIKNISARIFRTSLNKTGNNSNHTNPFGVSFKGNIINADVFEEKNSGLTERENKGKMLVSTLVGSINAIHSSIGRRLNSVVSFGRRIKETTTSLWDKANNVNMSDFLAARMPSFEGTYSVKNLKERPVSDLEGMFKEKLAAMEAQ